MVYLHPSDSRIWYSNSSPVLWVNWLSGYIFLMRFVHSDTPDLIPNFTSYTNGISESSPLLSMSPWFQYYVFILQQILIMYLSLFVFSNAWENLLSTNRPAPFVCNNSPTWQMAGRNEIFRSIKDYWRRRSLKTMAALIYGYCIRNCARVPETL